MHPQVLLAYGSPLAAILPRRWAESLAEGAGRAACGVSRRAGCNVDANLRQVLGDSVPKSLRRAVFQSYARYFLGMMRLAHRSAESALGDIHLSGSEAMEESLARQRGALVLSAHLGHWDVAAIAVTRRFGPMWVFVEPLRPARLLRFYTRVRARHGVRVLCVGETSRVPFEALRRNEVLGMLLDRPFGIRRTQVPFGEGSLQVPSGGIRLALRRGAGIHATFALRQGSGYQVCLGDDLTRHATARDLEERVCQVASAYAETLRHMVARAPGQWCMLQPLEQEARGAQRKRGRVGA